jgi:hypothetical protein
MYMLSGTRNSNSAPPLPPGKKDDEMYTFDKVVRVFEVLSDAPICANIHEGW